MQLTHLQRFEELMRELDVEEANNRPNREDMSS
jgi:hypothetical protein